MGKPRKKRQPAGRPAERPAGPRNQLRRLITIQNAWAMLGLLVALVMVIALIAPLLTIR